MLLSLLCEQRRRRVPQLSYRALGKTFVPFSSSQFVFDGAQRDVALRAFVPLYVAAQTLMQGIGNVLDLEVRHSMNMACPESAV